MALKGYRLTHSLVTFGTVYLISFIYLGKVFEPLYAWLLHIIEDIWTHKGSPVGRMQPFYPLSNYSIAGYIWWRNPKFWVPNWILLTLALYFSFMV